MYFIFLHTYASYSSYVVLLWCFMFIVLTLCSFVFIVFLGVTLLWETRYTFWTCSIFNSLDRAWICEMYMKCKCSSWLSQYVHHCRIFLHDTLQYWSALWSTHILQWLALHHNDQDCTVHRNRTNTVNLYSDLMCSVWCCRALRAEMCFCCGYTDTAIQGSNCTAVAVCSRQLSLYPSGINWTQIKMGNFYIDWKRDVCTYKCVLIWQILEGLI